jgi:hypothetical protein
MIIGAITTGGVTTIGTIATMGDRRDQHEKNQAPVGVPDFSLRVAD